MYLFAHRQAETIHGKVYFRGNTPAEGVAIEAFNAAGQQVGQTRTDGQGEFSLPIPSDVEVKLTAMTDDGHAAEPFILAPAEQSEQPAAIDVVPDGPEIEPSTLEAPQSPEDRPASSSDRAQLVATVEGAVGRQIAPLQRQLAQLQEEVRDQIEEVQGEMQDQITFRDYVGGIGYILGIMGLAFYFLGARRRDARVLGPGAENSKPPGRASEYPGK